MNNFRLWFKKLKYYKEKKLISLLFIILPLILSYSIILNFFNAYYASFEEYSFQNFSSDISVFTKYDNFQQFHKDIEITLDNRPYKGTLIKSIFPINLNFTTYSSDSKVSKFINESISFEGLNFSSNIFKNYYFSEFVYVKAGKLPQNSSEVIVPIDFKKIYNLNLNSIINFQYNKEINLNLTIVGFYESQELYSISSRNTFILLINNLNNQIFHSFKNIGFDLRYYFFLDHRQMDVFNTYSFTSEISSIQQSIELFFSNLTQDYVIFSSKSRFQSYEFLQYINVIILDLFTILIPIFFLTIIFFIMFSNYFSRMEIRIWDKKKYFLPKKKIKKNILFELFIDNFISYWIALPTAIGLYLLFNLFTYNKLARFDLFIPTSYYIFTIIFLVIPYLIMCFFILKRLNIYTKNDDKKSQTFKPDNFKKQKKIIFILGILVSLPIISTIFYFLQVSFFNPIQIIFTTILYGLASSISLIYSILIVLIIVIIIPGIIIKIIQYISRIPFRKLNNFRSKFLSKFFDFKLLTILVFVTFLSLEIGFINYYHFKKVNKYHQEEFELYLKIGSDIKISEPYSVNGLINLSMNLEHNHYCPINIIQGKIGSNLIIEENCAIISFNPFKYYSVLNDKSRSSINNELITLIDNLSSDEIIVPFYFKLRYNLNIGDSLNICPQNTSKYDGEFIKGYEKQMIIKGFFNFLPGLDNEATYYPTVYSGNNLIIITSSHFNYTYEFFNLPISRTFLVENINNTIDIFEYLAYNNTEIRYCSLKAELDKLNTSYLNISNNSIVTMFWLFIFVFLLMSFLIIYNFSIENKDFWYLFQLFNLTKEEVKKFIFWGLIGMFIMSFFIGLIGGLLSGIIIFTFENLTFKNNYYLYPIQLNLDLTGFYFNFIYIGISIFIIWFITNKLIDLTLDYEKIRKYNPE